jgi:hypothetical protein
MAEAMGAILPLAVGVALSPIPIVAVMTVLIVVIGFKPLGDGIAGC